MARIRLTKRLVDDFLAPETGQAFLWDAEIPGFGVRVTKQGGKAWIVQCRVRGGKQRRIVIGRCNKLALDRARIEARKIIGAAELGQDPAQERREAREVKPDTDPVFGDFADRWLDEVVAKRNRAGTEKHRRLLVKNHIKPHLGDKRLSEIGRKDIEDMHHAVSEKFPVAANRAVSVCSAILSAAVRWELLERNPALQAHRNSEEGRERYLMPDELKALGKALEESPAQDSADVVRLLLLTGARLGEVLAMRWDQLDLAAGVWTKPASTTKQNKTHRVPLSEPAVKVLKKRIPAGKKAGDGKARTLDRSAKKGNPWVFPGEGVDGHMTTIRTFWAAICKRAKIKSARIHDLRHTFASLLVSAGESLPVVGALLGHTQAKTTSRYAHLMDDALRAATEKVSKIAG
ncbi:MAG: tyrosine-type recombinase/integrase [Magnetospirillum sp.]|nr:tyrosine-type recombinase/integrase [Magnetospirillum sp.]